MIGRSMIDWLLLSDVASSEWHVEVRGRSGRSIDASMPRKQLDFIRDIGLVSEYA